MIDLIFSSLPFRHSKIKDAPHLAHLSFEDHPEFHKYCNYNIQYLTLIQNVFPALP